MTESKRKNLLWDSYPLFYPYIFHCLTFAVLGRKGTCCLHCLFFRYRVQWQHTLIFISSAGNNIISVTSDLVMRAIGQGIVLSLNKLFFTYSPGRRNVMAILRYVCVVLTSVDTSSGKGQFIKMFQSLWFHIEEIENKKKISSVMLINTWDVC